MQWTCLYYDPFQTCLSEPNRQYNPCMVMDLSNWKDFKKYKCYDRLKWHTCSIIPSAEFVTILREITEITASFFQFKTRDDLETLMERHCSTISYEKLPLDNTFFMEIGEIDQIQSVLYEHVIKIKMQSFEKIRKEYELNTWYMNKFWFVPYYGDYYRNKNVEFMAKKSYIEIDALHYAKYIIGQFKEMVSGIVESEVNNGIAIFYLI